MFEQTNNIYVSLDAWKSFWEKRKYKDLCVQCRFIAKHWRQQLQHLSIYNNGTCTHFLEDCNPWECALNTSIEMCLKGCLISEACVTLSSINRQKIPWDSCLSPTCIWWHRPANDGNYGQLSSNTFEKRIGAGKKNEIRLWLAGFDEQGRAVKS